MWIVRLALRRPYTFVIVALLIVLLGVVTILRTPTDIFPDVNIPVVSVIWSLTGTSVTDMEARIVTPSERAFTTSVNDIEHIESQTMPGVGRSEEHTSELQSQSNLVCRLLLEKNNNVCTFFGLASAPRRQFPWRISLFDGCSCHKLPLTLSYSTIANGLAIQASRPARRYAPLY